MRTLAALFILFSFPVFSAERDPNRLSARICRDRIVAEGERSNPYVRDVLIPSLGSTDWSKFADLTEANALFLLGRKKTQFRRWIDHLPKGSKFPTHGGEGPHYHGRILDEFSALLINDRLKLVRGSRPPITDSTTEWMVSSWLPKSFQERAAGFLRNELPRVPTFFTVNEDFPVTSAEYLAEASLIQYGPDEVPIVNKGSVETTHFMGFIKRPFITAGEKEWARLEAEMQGILRAPAEEVRTRLEAPETIPGHVERYEALLADSEGSSQFLDGFWIERIVKSVGMTFDFRLALTCPTGEAFRAEYGPGPYPRAKFILHSSLIPVWARSRSGSDALVSLSEMYAMRSPADREAFLQRYIFDTFQGPGSGNYFFVLDTTPTLTRGSYQEAIPNLSFELHGKHVPELKLEIEIVP